MARPDTAGFYYYGPFYGHSKSQIVPGGDDTDPVDNPTTPRVPCDDCPSGYDCENDECVKSGEKTLKPELIPVSDPTTETQCMLYTSRGSGISTTASGVFSGYDANSGGQWTFKCEDMVSFYGRLNHGALNDIRWGAGNHYRSFTVPIDSIDEQSIFHFVVYATGEYTIKIKRKNVGSTYYDWQLYQQGKLEEADGVNLFAGVTGGAQIWDVTNFDKDGFDEILFSGTGGQIIHHIFEQSIELRPADTSIGDSIFIMDRNLGATEYLGQSDDETKAYGDYYRWGAIVPGIEGGTDYHFDDDFAERWDLGEQSIVPSGWCIPDVDYVQRAIDLTREITGNVRGGRSQWLIPYAGFGYYIDSRGEIDWNYVGTGPAYFYLASLTYDGNPAPQLYMNGPSSSGNNYLVLRDLTTAGNPWYLPIRPFKKLSNT